MISSRFFKRFESVYRYEAGDPRFPSAIIARTIMGKGVSFMENKAKYHGSVLNESEAAKALEELGLDNPIAELKEKRHACLVFQKHFSIQPVYPRIDTGAPRTYGPGIITDNRSAYGAALEDLARLNNTGTVPKVIGFSCDLEGSVKMGGFHKISGNAFFESGIQEHHAATASGAISREGFVAFFSTFGIFGVTEVFNQMRLNDINTSNLKLVCTHLGLDVGEDGQTHQCIDYIGLLQNLFGFSIFIPADPNQTDRIVRYVAERPGNFFVGMGRSKLPAILDESGRPAFAGDYRFSPARADWLRHGDQAAILAYGPTIHEAVKAGEELAKNHGIRAAVLNFASIKPLGHRRNLPGSQNGPHCDCRGPSYRYGSWISGRRNSGRKFPAVQAGAAWGKKIRLFRKTRRTLQLRGHQPGRNCESRFARTCDKVDTETRGRGTGQDVSRGISGIKPAAITCLPFEKAYPFYSLSQRSCLYILWDVFNTAMGGWYAAQYQKSTSRKACSPGCVREWREPYAGDHPCTGGAARTSQRTRHGPRRG